MLILSVGRVVSTFPWDHNDSDYNLAYYFGQPLKIGHSPIAPIAKPAKSKAGKWAKAAKPAKVGAAGVREKPLLEIGGTQ